MPAGRPYGRSQAGRHCGVTAEGAGLTLGAHELRVAAPMLKRRWYELRVIAKAGRVRLRQTALQRSWGATDSATR